jgi:hypothetical protein
MGVQDRDWYREEQRRKREILNEARPHGDRPPLPSWARFAWNAFIGFALAGLVFLAWKHFL